MTSGVVVIGNGTWVSEHAGNSIVEIGNIAVAEAATGSRPSGQRLRPISSAPLTVSSEALQSTSCSSSTASAFFQSSLPPT